MTAFITSRQEISKRESTVYAALNEDGVLWG
jgi:hypothetical protein